MKHQLPLKDYVTRAVQTKVITLRLPRDLYEAIKLEAREQRASINRLCTGKVCQELQPESIDWLKKNGEEE